MPDQAQATTVMPERVKPAMAMPEAAMPGAGETGCGHEDEDDGAGEDEADAMKPVAGNGELGCCRSRWWGGRWCRCWMIRRRRRKLRRLRRGELHRILDRASIFLFILSFSFS